MKGTRRLLSITLLAALIVATSSCGLFRKKNKCNTCPHFDDMPAAHASMEKKENK